MTNMYVGDLHGEIYLFENAIQEFELKKYDKLIFIGDYVDSYTCTDVEILHLLNLVIEYKKKYPEKVECLLGNHIFGYIKYFSYIVV